MVAYYDAANQTTTGDTSDSNYSDVSLLLHMNGLNNSATFDDYGPDDVTITRVGALIKTDQFKFGGSSAYFNGIANILKTATIAQ